MLMLLAAALLVVTGCKKDNKDLNVEKMTFKASIDNGNAKTFISFSGDDGILSWTENDEVNINGKGFTAKNVDNFGRATFEGETVAPDADGKYKAIFPANLYQDGNYVLPATQTYAANNLSGVNPMYAESTTTDLEFRSICALMKLNLKGTTGSEKVTKIEVTANEPLSGVFYIDDYKAVLGRNQNSAALTLDCGEGATLSTDGTTFYIAIPEGSYTDLTFTVTSDGGTWTYKAGEDGRISVAANCFYESTQTPEFVPAAEYPYLCFTAVEAGATVNLKKTGSPELPDLETSTDGKKWTAYTLGSEINLQNKGDKVYFRKADSGVAPFTKSTSDYAYFAMTGKIAASGNVMSLIDPSCEATAIPCKNCFYKLFLNCASLTAAPALPATTLTISCYSNMFNGCTSLTAAPELPAMTLATSCYYYMFNGCTSLTAAPELPATTLATNCYYSMFYGCTSLTTAPELPATTLATNCYYFMFQNCSSLNYIKVHFTTWGQNTTNKWLSGVSSTGTFHCPSGLPETHEEGFIPTGWSVEPF